MSIKIQSKEIQEVWRKIPDTIYSVSSIGRLRNDVRGSIKKPSVDRDGYLYYCLSFNGKKQNKRSHRLVAEQFISNYSEDLVVNHKDFNRQNNYFQNLEMCTLAENVKYSNRAGRYSGKYGELNANCKHDFATILMLKTYLDAGLSCADISRKTGINRRYINGIKLGKRCLI